MTNEIKKAPCILRNVPYVSVWDGGVEIKSTCSIDAHTGFIQDISLVEGGDILEFLEWEYVVLNDQCVDVRVDEEGRRFVQLDGRPESNTTFQGLPRARPIQGCVYRVKMHPDRAILVETSAENSWHELVNFCAYMVAQGNIITFVTRIFPFSTDTPRVAVLSSKDYKEALSLARPNGGERDVRGSKRPL